jgi:hypothetical protein
LAPEEQLADQLPGKANRYITDPYVRRLVDLAFLSLELV